jgi:hypothetical protein
MSLTTADYEAVRKHLRYFYSDLTELTDILDSLASQYGSIWITKLQALLTQLSTADQTLTTQIATPQFNELQIEGAYHVYYPDTSSGLTAANLSYNKLISELVLLTGITVNGTNTKIYRG